MSYCHEKFMISVQYKSEQYNILNRYSLVSIVLDQTETEHMYRSLNLLELRTHLNLFKIPNFETY